MAEEDDPTESEVLDPSEVAEDDCPDPPEDPDRDVDAPLNAEDELWEVDTDAVPDDPDVDDPDVNDPAVDDPDIDDPDVDDPDPMQAPSTQRSPWRHGVPIPHWHAPVGPQPSASGPHAVHAEPRMPQAFHPGRTHASPEQHPCGQDCGVQVHLPPVHR